jgi:hypothetical protein
MSNHEDGDTPRRTTIEMGYVGTCFRCGRRHDVTLDLPDGLLPPTTLQCWCECCADHPPVELSGRPWKTTRRTVRLNAPAGKEPEVVELDTFTRDGCFHIDATSAELAAALPCPTCRGGDEKWSVTGGGTIAGRDVKTTRVCGHDVETDELVTMWVPS